MLIRYRLKSLLRAWRLSAAAVVVVALVVGASTSVYAVIHAVLFSSGDDPHLAGVVNIYNSNPQQRSGSLQSFAVSLPDFADLRRSQQTLSRVMAFVPFHAVMRSGDVTRSIVGEAVAGDYFETLNARPASGRLVGESDNHPDAPPAAVISHRLWQGYLDGQDDIVGSTIFLNGSAFEVAGVAPPGFRGSFVAEAVPAAAWIPLVHAGVLSGNGQDLATDGMQRDRRVLLIRGQLRPGTSVSQASADVARLGALLDAMYPSVTQIGPHTVEQRREWIALRASEVSLHGQGTRILKPLAWLTMSMITLVLLVAASNIANLMIARGVDRAQDMAMAVALGATRKRLVWEQVYEQGLLALLGGIGGVLAAAIFFLPWLRSELLLTNGVVLQIQPRLAWRVLGMAGALTLVPFLVFGLLPAMLATGDRAKYPLRAGPVAGPRRTAIRDRLLVLQVAAWSSARERVSALTAGVEPTGLWVTHTRPERTGTADSWLVQSLLDAAVESGPVEHVAVVSGLPFGDNLPRGRVSIVREDSNEPPVPMSVIGGTEQLFDTVGLPLLRGSRPSDPADVLGESPVWLSKRAAKVLFGDQTALGQTVRVGFSPQSGSTSPSMVLAVVRGIVGDSGSAVGDDADSGILYMPLAATVSQDLYVVVRARGESGDLSRTLHESILRSDRRIAVVSTLPGREFVDRQMRPLLGAGKVLAVLGGSALGLAIVGLVGMLMHIVATGRRETAIRLALGAVPLGLALAVVRRGMKLVAVGLGLGVVAVAGVMKLISHTVANVPSTMDPHLLGGLVVLVVLSALAATGIPALAAARIQPAERLRD
jgi:predicted permease